MTDIPGLCQCGDPFHGATCFHCGCSSFTEDDGTDGPRTMLGLHQTYERYDGVYGTREAIRWNHDIKLKGLL